jgi:competence protein ComEC
VVVIAAAAIWVGALAGPWVPPPLAGLAIIVAIGVSFLTRQRVVLLMALVGVGILSGSLAHLRTEGTLAASVARGRGVVVGVATTDAAPFGDRYRFLLRPSSWQQGEMAAVPWQGPSLMVVADESDIAAGETVHVSGLMRAAPDVVRGDPVAGRITATAVTRASGTAPLVVDAGNAIRRRVQNRLAVLGETPEAGLLGGFLIGDVALLPDVDNEALRRAGLTHYVAVSGSNVALVLGAWWLALALTGAGNRTRSATGLAVLAVFVVVTRWESSVIRAATMAALVMGGRALGVSVDAWAALGGAVAILLAVSGDLAYDVGFQLSVVATAGVLLGMHIWSHRSPRLFWGVLAATVSAQLAVVPLLLVHFGTVPLLSPLANLVAAPLVTGATALAGVGVIASWDPPLHIAEILAGAVLRVARTAAGWPQLGTWSVVALSLWLAVTWQTRLRWVALVMVGAVVAAGMIPPGPPAVPTVVWLDVGQGDAVLLLDPSGAVALMDGGREPLVLRDALRRHGIGRIDLLVASHGDADHIGGFGGLFEDVAVGRVWVPAYVEPRELLDDLITQAGEHGVAVDAVAAGAGAVLGELAIEVYGPARRFAEENNGSIVLVVGAGRVTVLLPGDIGAVAQRGLPELDPDLLMVPHHGAATSDIGWLTSTVGATAIISVGPNTYGHPAPEVVDGLREAGAQVLTTWEHGDIAVPLR